MQEHAIPRQATQECPLSLFWDVARMLHGPLRPPEEPLAPSRCAQRCSEAGGKNRTPPSPPSAPSEAGLPRPPTSGSASRGTREPPSPRWVFSPSLPEAAPAEGCLAHILVGRSVFSDAPPVKLPSGLSRATCRPSPGPGTAMSSGGGRWAALASGVPCPPPQSGPGPRTPAAAQFRSRGPAFTPQQT